jgi:MYXO-CTERM domain-containing protein
VAGFEALEMQQLGTSRRIVALGAVLGAAAACGAPSSGEPTEADIAARYPHDDRTSQHFQANPDFHPQPADFALQRRALTREGEVLVIEGGPGTVTVGGVGAFGITEDNQIAIVQEVLAQYPDEFDTIQIYTSFVDQAHQGIAYYQGLRNTVAGIGISGFDSRAAYGLGDTGRLSGFSNMNSMLMWGNGSFDGLNAVEGYYHGVIAHELSHRWLFHVLFTDPSGNTNSSLLGRDDAHWSRLAHAYGSVHDGNFFVDNGDGSFTNQGTDKGFSPLELYAMGRIPAEAVEDFFYLTEATLEGEALNKLSSIPVNAMVRGNRVDVAMSQVVDEMGPRNPPYGFESPYYRAAFVLVTAPGEARQEWAPHLAKLQEVQAGFPETWRRWTGGGICTQVTARCPEPILGLAEVTVSDGNDDIPAPGEQVQVHLSAQNVGLGGAEGATVRLEAVGDTVTVQSTEAKALPVVPQGGSAALSEAFDITISADTECAQFVTLRAIFTAREGPTFSEDFTINVGTRVVRADPLNEAPNWTVDPDDTDTALKGVWEFGDPELVTVLGLVLQPDDDHTPGDGKLSFNTGLARGNFFSDNDVDGGRTTLESPVFALGDTLDPILTFYYWHMAADLSRPGEPGPVEGSDLLVQASNDGGATWADLGTLSERTTEWSRAAFRIRDAVAPSNRVRFRFVIADETEMGTVEAGIDDLEIIDFVEGCDIDLPDPDPDPEPTPNPDGDRDTGGCGCTAAEAGGASGLAFMVGLLGLAVLSRRRGR